MTWYDGCVYIDLSTVECTIAMPMHPSNTFTIHELLENAADILHEVQEAANRQIKGAKLEIESKYHDGGIWVEQGEIAGCAGGTFDNICAAADILRGQSIGNGAFSLSVYPGSMPALAELVKNGRAADLITAGVIMRECFCGPCFGAGDCPANGEFSIRHTTRNFPNREGSKPGEGQMSAVALMDARSIAATARNGGRLTAATDLDVEYTDPEYHYDAGIYAKRVYNGWGHPEPEHPLKFGPNIKDWPEMPALTDDLLVKVCSYITDPVTTTDELIPSGETSAYRSNPERLSEFALSRRDPSTWAAARPCARSSATAARERACPRRSRTSTPRLRRPASAPTPSTPTSAPPSSPTCPATAPPGSRRRPASASWAAAPTSPGSTPPSATAPTASTGAWCPSWWSIPRCLSWATTCSSPACARPCWRTAIHHRLRRRARRKGHPLRGLHRRADRARAADHRRRLPDQLLSESLTQMGKG